MAWAYCAHPPNTGWTAWALAARYSTNRQIMQRQSGMPHADPARQAAPRAVLPCVAFGALIVLAATGAAADHVWPHKVEAAFDAATRLVTAHNQFGWITCAALQVIVAMSGILPASVGALGAGTMFGTGCGFLLCGPTTMAGAWLAFLLSRSLFRPCIIRALAHHPRMGALDEAIGRDGWRLVFLLRISPIMPFAATSYALGLTSIGPRPYIKGTLASLPRPAGLCHDGRPGRRRRYLVHQWPNSTVALGSIDGGDRCHRPADAAAGPEQSYRLVNAHPARQPSNPLQKLHTAASYIALILFGSFALALAISSLTSNWSLGPFHPSPLSHTMPEEDFFNLWSAGNLVRESKLDWIYSSELFDHWKLVHFGSSDPHGGLDLSADRPPHRRSVLLSAAGSGFPALGFADDLRCGRNHAFGAPAMVCDCRRAGRHRQLAVSRSGAIRHHHRRLRHRRPRNRAASPDTGGHLARLRHSQAAAGCHRSDRLARFTLLACDCFSGADVWSTGGIGRPVARPRNLGLCS